MRHGFRFNLVGFWFILRFSHKNFWNDKFVLYFEVFLLIISFFLNLIQIILKVEQIFGIIVIGATTRRRVDGGSLFAGSL